MKPLREAFERALADSSEIDRALDEAEALLAARSDDPVAMAYVGSLHAMKAGASALPWVKLKHANAASALLDGAHERRFDTSGRAVIDGHPADLEVALLRGVAYANFPAFLGQAEAARSSLEEAIRHPSFAAIPERYRALTCSHLAVLCHRAGEENRARAYLDNALDLDEAAALPVWAKR